VHHFHNQKLKASSSIPNFLGGKWVARHRRKGSRVECEILDWHRQFGAQAERYSLSGVSRSYSGGPKLRRSDSARAASLNSRSGSIKPLVAIFVSSGTVLFGSR
jgi:hypothetical protein